MNQSLKSTLNKLAMSWKLSSITIAFKHLKDNPSNERFNQTLQNKFIALGNFQPDLEFFNQDLTEWLIEYNFFRLSEALNYETPLEFSKVLPMHLSWTAPVVTQQ